MKTKKILFTEYTYVLHEYPAEVEISLEDFHKLKSGKMDLKTIVDKYSDIDYDCDEPIYDDSYVHSYEYDGEA